MAYDANVDENCNYYTYRDNSILVGEAPDNQIVN